MSKRKCFHLNCTVLLYATVPATYFYYYRKIDMLVIRFQTQTDSEEKIKFSP